MKNKLKTGNPAQSYTSTDSSYRMSFLVSLDIYKQMSRRDIVQMNKVNRCLSEGRTVLALEQCVELLGQQACLVCSENRGEEQTGREQRGENK